MAKEIGSGVPPAGVVTEVEVTSVGVKESIPSSRFSFPLALDGRSGLRSLPALAPRRSGVAETSRESVRFFLEGGPFVVTVVFFFSGFSGAGHSTS